MTAPIVLRRRKTRFVALFRATPPRTVCPNFYVLAHANGCAFRPRCSYCYLKSSFWHVPNEQAFSNVEAMLGEVRDWIRRDGLESCVLNTGNLSDSLAFEAFRPLVADLVDIFRREAEAPGRPHTLLLVTKGGARECRPLRETAPCANVVVSFSVNNAAAAARHEQGAPPVRERLSAARQLKRRGWRVRMRIDPMIAGYRYARIARQVAGLAPERVTLGTLRSEPNLDRYLAGSLRADLRRPPGRAALARYPRATRLALYREALRPLDGTCPVALCEETPAVWDALGLDRAAAACNCGL